MNRLVLIGNGFDLAHGLKTSYPQFIKETWNNIITKVLEDYEYNSDLFSLQIIRKADKIQIRPTLLPELFKDLKATDYKSLVETLKFIQENYKEYLIITCDVNNSLFLHLTNKINEFENWVDIEEEYYKFLKCCGKVDDLQNDPIYCKYDNISDLNRDFNQIKDALNQYLDQEQNRPTDTNTVIYDRIYIEFEKHDFGLNLGLTSSEISSVSGQLPKESCFLNFNYTNLERHYKHTGSTIIHIHGEINSNESNNPIIFGYGDELDTNYKDIENLNNNDYLENIKSIKYFYTDNYKKLLGFIQKDKFQIIILGHSCGNSDRTLLNTIFHHENCVSIKPYFYKRQYHEKGILIEKDNYNDIIKNISRSFTDKALMRDKVVSKKYCSWFSLN